MSAVCIDRPHARCTLHALVPRRLRIERWSLPFLFFLVLNVLYIHTNCDWLISKYRSVLEM